jgi:hypothetical protein
MEAHTCLYAMFVLYIISFLLDVKIWNLFCMLYCKIVIYYQQCIEDLQKHHFPILVSIGNKNETM